MTLLARLARRYRREFPGIRFRVRRSALKTELGVTGLRHRDGVFTVELDQSLPEAAMLILLSHEVAHVISWHLDPPERPHGPAFWAAHQRTYEIYEKFCDEVNS
jgi:hypothetical protein